MDLNYLMQREQVERVHAGIAATPNARAAHRELADIFRDRIDFRRRAMRGHAGLDPALALPRL